MMLCRSLKAEKDRYQQEMAFQLNVMELENQRRAQEREHEMRIFSLLLGGNMQSQNVTHQPLLQCRNQIPDNFSGFSHNSYTSHTSPLNASDNSSDTSSSANVESNALHYYYSF